MSDQSDESSDQIVEAEPEPFVDIQPLSDEQAAELYGDPVSDD